MSNYMYEKIMDILEDERMTELTCAKITEELMKKTLNPFKRIKFKHSYKMFLNHSVGVQLAINRIKKEIES